jgi:hypothetical protein
MSPGFLLVGGGHVELPGGWDAGPLVLALVVVLGMRAAGTPVRPSSLLVAFVAGLAADVGIGATHLSLFSAVSIGMVVVALLALRRAQHERRGARRV